jgi:primosomal protein N' (replication factor Y)
MIFKVAIASPLFQLFDYLPPLGVDINNIQLGCRVVVPFGSGDYKKVAFLVELAETSDWELGKLKRVEKIIDQPSLLSAHDLTLLNWVSRYYHHPIGEVISMAFPVALRNGKAAVIVTEQHYTLTELGKQTDSQTLQRAPKQQALLEKFQQHDARLSASQLTGWQTIIKQLINKQLVQLETPCEISKAYPSKLLNNPALVSNPAQQAAIDSVCASLNKFNVFLLEGVTGSGKTEVYLQIIHTVLQQGRQVLVLVPEITLTPQLESRFKQRFAVDIAISHSRLSDKERQTAWLQTQQGQCAILLGTRSALFTPFQNLGLIILDEEHDSSFKQQENGVRFSARDTAVMRGKLLNIPVLLGSATPSLETLHNVAKQRYQWLHLPERAGDSIPPALWLLDIRNKKMREGLSDILLAEIHATLAKNEQVLLFLNRRGFAPTLMCHACGWIARCQHCTANLVIHKDQALLRCHHCGTEHRLPPHCPDCKAPELTPLGLGTERVEKVLRSLFVDKSILRLDRDSTQRKGVLDDYLEQINQGKVDIILGTQMLAKGHHFPNVTLVALLDVDSGLFSVDFHATEKLAQLIVQVSGRAGREDKRGKVIMQTRQPTHALLTTLIEQGYQQFANSALQERQQADLPPFSYHALLSAEAKDDSIALNFLQQIICLADKTPVQLLGPVTAPMSKRAGFYRYQLLLQSPSRADLHSLLDKLIPEIAKLKTGQKIRWSLDVDPVDLY